MKNEQLAGVFYPLATMALFVPIFFIRPITNWPILILCWLTASIIIFVITVKKFNSRYLFLALSLILYIVPTIMATREESFGAILMIILYPAFLVGSGISFGIGFYFNRKAKTDQDSSQIQSAISTTKSSSSYLRTIAFMIIGLVLFLSPQLSTLGSTSDIFYIAGFVSIPLGILFMLIALVDGLINLFRK